jgi:hypothetical protein
MLPERRRSQDVDSLDCQHPRREQHSSSGGSRPAGAFDGAGNGELPPAGPKGAQHALGRLELEEEQGIAGCNLRFNAVIKLRSRALNSSGYAVSRACENWIFRSSWPDATPNNRCRCDRLAMLHCSFRTGSESVLWFFSRANVEP